MLVGSVDLSESKKNQGRTEKTTCKALAGGRTMTTNQIRPFAVMNPN
jgi:hypothetical protein